jgi:hypothetical protein
VTSAALAGDDARHAVESGTVIEMPAPAAAHSTLRTRLAIALIVLVQIAWLAALGYAVLAFV